MSKVVTSKKGNMTITRNTLGSNDKTLSILINTSEPLTLEAAKEIGNQSPLTLVTGYENIILSWLKNNNLPTECKNDIDLKNLTGSMKTLPCLLTNEYAHVIGSTQAGNCLHSIEAIKEYISRDNYRNACYESLDLVKHYSFFIYAINEGSINSGNKSINNLGNKKLSEECIKACNKEVEKIKNERRVVTKIEFTKKQIREKLSTFIYNNYAIKVKAETLRRNYSKKIVV